MSQVWNHWQKNTFVRRKRKNEKDDDDSYLFNDKSTECNSQIHSLANRTDQKRKAKKLILRPLERKSSSSQGMKKLPDFFKDQKSLQNVYEDSNKYGIMVDFSVASDAFNCGDSCVDDYQYSQKNSQPVQLKCGTGEQKDIQERTKKSFEEELIETVVKSHCDLSETYIRQIISCIVSGTSLNVTEDMICGLNEVKTLVKNKIMRPLLKPEIHKGLYKAAKGILLFGPPGTGKTTIAKWLATECNATFYNITPSVLTSKFYGESETLVKALFCTASKTLPSIIFIDELDSILNKRSDKEEESTTRMKNQLLQQIDGINSSEYDSLIIVGATNRPDSLDDAALRRFSKRIYIPLPNAEDRAKQIIKLLEQHADDMGLELNCNLDWVNRIADKIDGFNGSDIKALCSKAAEYVYERVLEENNNSIDNITCSTFWLPGENEFKDAVGKVNSSVCNAVNSREHWQCLKDIYSSC